MIRTVGVAVPVIHSLSAASVERGDARRLLWIQQMRARKLVPRSTTTLRTDCRLSGLGSDKDIAMTSRLDSVVILGAGVMGQQIAGHCWISGKDVRLYDVKPQERLHWRIVDHIVTSVTALDI